MIDRLRHRGPDDHGWLSYSRHGLLTGQGAPDDGPAEVVLLHRRLSILDLSEAGRQPMATPDGRFHIVFNGEIYNYLELREELAAAGFKFRTGTDTEVLLAAVARWGTEALQRLVGMFAFAVLDTQTRTLLLVRDFFGIKPLFYCLTPEGFAFASEIKALIELPGAARRINPRALLSYLSTGAADHTSETMLAGIRHLPPAHFVEISLDGPIDPKPRQYWRIDPKQTVDLSFEEAAEQLRELFLESVRLHLRSDVPVGTALSGGIDSSAIVMAIHKIAGEKVDFHNFSFIADDPAVDEERWVDTVAHASGTTVHKVRITPHELVADLDDLIAAQDEPFGSTSIYAQYRVFRLAQEAGVKVLLDGQGADEMLAGYRMYVTSRLVSLLRGGRLLQAAAFLRHAVKQPRVDPRHLLYTTCGSFVPGAFQSWARRLVDKDSSQQWLNRDWFNRQGVTDATCDDTPRQGPLRSMLIETFSRTNLPNLLRYEDRNSMAFSIESRVPFLTPEIVKFVFSLPEDYLISSDGTSKHVFRAAMRGIVPDAILDRRDKVGFSTPEHAWLQTLRPWVRRVLRSDAAREIPALRHDVVFHECNQVLSGHRKFDWRVWRWLNLIRWSEQLGVQY